MSELRDEYREMFFTTSADWNADGANAVLERLAQRCRSFAQRNADPSLGHRVEFAVEARYEGQVWEIDIPLRVARFGAPGDLEDLVADFHAQHEEIFAVRDPGSAVEFVGWTASVSCALRRRELGRLAARAPHGLKKQRSAYFENGGEHLTPIHELGALPINDVRQGPAIIETAFTTTVVDPHAQYWHAQSGSLVIKP